MALISESWIHESYNDVINSRTHTDSTGASFAISIFHDSVPYSKYKIQDVHSINIEIFIIWTARKMILENWMIEYCFASLSRIFKSDSYRDFDNYRWVAACKI